MKDLTPITPEALIELGFESSDFDTYQYHMNGSKIEVHECIMVYICILYDWHDTNATTIEDIKDLIRLFK